MPGTGSNQYQTRPGCSPPDSPAGSLLDQLNQHSQPTQTVTEELVQQAQEQTRRDMYQRLAAAPRDTALWAAVQPDCPDDIRHEIYELALTNGGGYGAQNLLDNPIAMRYISDPAAANAILRWAGQGFVKDPVDRLMKLPQCGPAAIAKAVDKWPAQMQTLQQHPSWDDTVTRKAQKIASSSRGQWDVWVRQQPKPAMNTGYFNYQVGDPGYTANLWAELDEQGRNDIASFAPPEHLSELLDRINPESKTGGAYGWHLQLQGLRQRKGRQLLASPDLIPTQHQIDLMWARPSPRTVTSLKVAIVQAYRWFPAPTAIPAAYWDHMASMKDGGELWGAVADNPACPPEALGQMLCRTSSPDIRERLLNNPGLPGHLRAMWQLAH